uniref:Ion transport domain-containing protein n=1 Tax=Esox lucius TaxID=8010 RepID=A0A3P8Y128_ESOLU
KINQASLVLYICYTYAECRGLNAGIFVILALAFIEKPSSLSVTSDLRFKHTLWNPPCGLTEVIEIICLLVFTLDLVVKSYLIGREEFLKCKWLVGYMVVIMVSVIDWTMSLSMTCDETVRIRKLLRPFYLLQNSSLMKKSLKCIKRTLPGITSVILLVILHLCLFTIFGMLLFAKREEDMERELYFKNLSQSLTSLLVLLTTANNPDVMTPAYTLHRGFSIFFILFSGFGTYFLMNLLTAIIYNQFRGYLMSVQTSILRRCMGIRAAFDLLHCQSHRDITFSEDDTIECIPVQTVQMVMKRVQMKDYYREAIMKVTCQSYSGRIPREAFQRLFDELDKDRIKKHHPLPEYSSKFLQMVQYIFTKHSVTVVGNVVALANVVCICIILVIECEKTVSEREDYLETVNCFFILYYLLEMLLKMTAFGWKTYVSYGSNIFDGSLTVLLLVGISIFSTYRLPFSYWNPVHGGPIALWELVRLVNMLIVFRFLRIIPNIKLMALVASTLVDLVKNLRAFAGILVVVYYVFAILGVWLFKGAITAHSAVNKSLQCGSYEQLGYWSNNFDDFASALVLLYNIMMMNNWNVFLDAYSRYTTEWSKIYFIAWWLTSSVMWVNLFVALILEVKKVRQIEEPTEEEVVTKLHAHHHLQHLTMSVSVDQT